MKSYIKTAMLFLVVASLTFIGCLKDKDYDDGKIQSLRSLGTQRIIELSLTATSTLNYQLLSLDGGVDTAFHLIPVTLASGSPASEDIKVVLLPNPALIGNYNAEHGTAHDMAPTSTYTISNPVAAGGGFVVTIPKGSNTGFLDIALNTDNFLGNDYALGFQIGKIETPGYLISSNISTGIVAIGIKNEYEGEYYATGFFAHPTVPRDIDREAYLKTAGATSVSKVLGDLDGTNIVINITSVTFNNTYDPVTKTFWLKYGYPQPGPTRIITEKVVMQ